VVKIGKSCHVFKRDSCDQMWDIFLSPDHLLGCKLGLVAH